MSKKIVLFPTVLLVAASIVYVWNVLSENARMTQFQFQGIEFVLIFFYLVFFTRGYLRKEEKKESFLILVIFVNLTSAIYEFRPFWMIIHITCYICLYGAFIHSVFKPKAKEENL